jgi:hypothetical protein
VRYSGDDTSDTWGTHPCGHNEQPRPVATRQGRQHVAATPPPAPPEPGAPSRGRERTSAYHWAFVTARTPAIDTPATNAPTLMNLGPPATDYRPAVPDRSRPSASRRGHQPRLRAADYREFVARRLAGFRFDRPEPGPTRTSPPRQRSDHLAGPTQAPILFTGDDRRITRLGLPVHSSVLREPIRERNRRLR